MEVEFVVLANSRKPGGRCVAGIRTDTGEWVRPVPTPEGGALGSQHYQLPGSGSIPLLHVVRAEFIDRSPLPGQPENWLVSKRGWTIVRQMSPLEASFFLQPYLFPGPDLFGDTSYRIQASGGKLPTVKESLVLVEPRNIRWTIEERQQDDQPRRPRKQALFNLSGAAYRLTVTDPVWEDKLSNPPGGEQHPAEADGHSPKCRRCFTISLGEPFKDGYCYKLVAGVIPLP